MYKRNLLYLVPGEPDVTLPPYIASAGWDIHVAMNVTRAAELVDGNGFHVGLCLLEPYREAVIRQWADQLFRHNPNMEWVGLLHPSYLEQDDIRTFILEYLYDFHSLPPDPERLLITLGHAYGMAEIARRNIEQITPGNSSEYEMVGSSPVMLELFHTIRKIADGDAPILITGESGTGKELTALSIHERSHYASGRFIAVNCGALPSELIQSELFGHEKGAFTGAYERKIGRIEAADGGTILLDEIGDLPWELQINLLRFLEQKTIQRVGSTKDIPVNTRVIAATHVDLDKAVQEGRFREDLYYRLNVLHVRMPALRERNGDIELLARFFFDKFSKDKRGNVKGFSQLALQMMNSHDWPGNVRELINRVRRALVMCENRLITPADLGLERRQSNRRLLTLDAARAQAEKKAVNDVLSYTRRNISLAARELGVTRATLYRLINKFEIQI